MTNTPKSLPRRAALAAAFAVLTLGAVPQARAQPSGEEPAPRVAIPKPRGEPKATPIMSILTAVVLAAGIVSITLLPSKRGHQD